MRLRLVVLLDDRTTEVLVVAIAPPPRIHPLLVVLHTLHVGEGGDCGRDRPEERQDHLDQNAPEAQDVPEAPDAPERPVLAEYLLAPDETTRDPAGVHKGRLEVASCLLRPRHTRVVVVVHVVPQGGGELGVRVVCPVGLAGHPNEPHTANRRKDKPQHAHEHEAGHTRPQHQAPGEHADSHQVQRQPQERPGVSPGTRHLEIDRLVPALALERTVDPLDRLDGVVFDLSAAVPAPPEVQELEEHDPGDDAKDCATDDLGSPHLKLRQGTQPRERRQIPQTQVLHPLHGRQTADLGHEAFGQGSHLFSSKRK